MTFIPNPPVNQGALAKVGVTAPPSRPATTTATPSLYQQAIDQAQAALQAQITPLQGQIASNDATTAQRVSDATANAQALSELLKSIAPAISGTYTQAADTQGTLAKGFSTDTQAALDQNASGIDKTLAGIGAPAGQNIDPSQSGKVADVLYGLGGFIPGSTFAQKGAAYAGAAAMLPAGALLQGLSNAQQVRLAGQAADTVLQNKIAELAGKLPGDVQTNYMNLQKLALDSAKFSETLKKDQFDQAYKIAQQKLATAKYNSSIDEFNVNTKLKGQSLQLQANKFAQQTFNADRNYQLALTRIGISKRSLQLRIAASEYTMQHGGFGRAKVAGFNQTLDALQANPPTNQKLRTYQAFIAAALKKGVPISMAIQRANTMFPVQDQNLGALMSMPGVAKDWAGAVKDTGQTADQNNQQTTGQAPKPASTAAKQGYQNYAFSRFKSYGWSKQDAASLQSLWDGESGWDPGITNKSSGASGIPQSLGHTLPPNYANNAKVQIDWGLKYIKGRYGNPTRAWAFWQATVNKDASAAPPDLRATAEYWIAHGYAGY